MVDHGGMRSAIEGMGDQLLEGDRSAGRPAVDLAMPTAGVIAGMGGSAMSGELLRGRWSIGDCAVPITRVRGFGVPKLGGAGDAGRVLELLGRHRPRRCPAPSRRTARAPSLLCVGMGGRARASWAREWGAPFAQVPAGLQPRAALGYLFGAMAGAFGCLWPGARQGSRGEARRGWRRSTGTRRRRWEPGWRARCR